MVGANEKEKLMSRKLLTKEDCATVLVVAITPRLPDLSLDLEGVRRNARHLWDHGVQVAMPECGTGLVYDATLAEYEAVVGTWMEEVGEALLVVPGIGPGYGRALEMGHIARSLGVPGVMIMPVVGPASAAGVEEGMRRIAEQVALPTVLYQRRLDLMPVDQVVRLCRLDEVVGLKYAVNDTAAFATIAAQASQDAAMLCGMAEEPCLDYLERGALGFSSGMANFVPRMSLALLRAFQQGNSAEARRLRDLMVPFEDLRGERGARYSGSALHAAMEVADLAGGAVVPFAEDVAAEDLPRLRAMVEELIREEQSLRQKG
ncbi:MAG: dihydrodipicolinate synthase family protein [Candidatus Latescibacteria bacterium]|nr:dihydrodipicolinate synthase family protein [Candidatus Latescibacterota bacterium]